MKDTLASRLFSLHRLARLVPFLIGAVIALTAFELGRPAAPGAPANVNDFTAFHIGGQLILDGRIEILYDTQAWFAWLAEQAGMDMRLAWPFPPHFAFFAAALALFPLNLAYLLYMGLGFALFWRMTKRLAGDNHPFLVLMFAPIMALVARRGQNGFMEAGLMGFALMHWQASGWRTPLALATLTVKPHLGTGLALLALLERKGGLIIRTVVLTAVLAGAAVALFGFGPFTGFAGSMQLVAAQLEAGNLNIPIMASVYAGLKSLGAPHIAALTAHVAVVLALIVTAIRSDTYRTPAALALCLTVSPYLYDYDLPIAAILLAMLLPELRARITGPQALALALIAWAMSARAIFTSSSSVGLAYPALALIAMAALVLFVLTRPRHE